ncbi:WD40 repeat-like protein [Macrolepiota fuliginosa MF-IS2]|uniref:WD40 repeat-like protein n=1 Tax=Macrolepiota fuliginosa MF-IS2 TaxID=1400762 RepID=A0A9P5X430_9AGAR|nr:WD40 repeat-like protein [Macrolepiota fuliginosa MF-IS2]
MSYKPSGLFPSNPVTARGAATRISSWKDKVVYTNGKTVIIRDLSKSSTGAVTYLGHVHNATVARFSPSGYYCASADVNGTVRIWDTVGEDQALKGEYKVISGRINDLAWDGESKRIIAVGDGRERFGYAFNMDTGTSVGDISGHSKVISAVSIRQQRPFRAATASDDTTIVFHQGPPFKFDKLIKTHTKFVQDVKFSPSGDLFASVGSDSKIFLYDGQAGETVAEITDSPHKGTIFAASWSPDSKSIFTSSADKTVKLWDVEARKAVTTWTVGSGVDDQQLGNTWSGDNNLVSLSLGGDLNVFDPRTADKPARIFTAPQAAINAITSTGADTFLTGTATGRVYSYSVAEGESAPVSGTSHSAYISGLATSPSDDKVYSIGWDDKVREISGGSFVPAVAPTAAQPKSVAVASDSTVFVAEIGTVEAFRSNQKVLDLKASYAPSAVAASGKTVVVGAEDNKVRLYDWDGKSLKEAGVLEVNRALISALAFSPDGKYLAAGDSSGKIILYDVAKKEMVTGRWTMHSARIHSLSWTSDSKHVASGSLDTNVYIWSVEKPLKYIGIKNAASNGVNGVLWVGPGKLASAGADGIVRLWSVTFHA